MNTNIQVFLLAIGLLCVQVVSAQESTSFQINDEFPNYGGATQESAKYQLRGDTTWHEQPATSTRFKVSQFGAQIVSSSSSVSSSASSVSTSSSITNVEPSDGGNRRPETIDRYISSLESSSVATTSSEENTNQSSSSSFSSSLRSAATEDELQFTIPTPPTIGLVKPIEKTFVPTTKKGIRLESNLLAKITQEVAEGTYFAVAPRTVLPTVDYKYKNSCTIFDEVSEVNHASANSATCEPTLAETQCIVHISALYNLVYVLLSIVILLIIVLLIIVHRHEYDIERILQSKKK